jgi:hydroxyethylthiazole kinase-like uncharacterized protein yjeF
VYILTADQIRQWDQFTIQNEPVASIDLMERAASKCVEWIDKRQWRKKHFLVFCGKGNNGGDGLAIARLLTRLDYRVSVYILEFGKPGSEDFQTNLQRLHEDHFNDIHFIQSKENFPHIETADVVIDALFGSGLNKPLQDLSSELVDHINKAKALVISIDLPSGMFTDQSAKGKKIIEADYTLSFQTYKTALLIQENAPHTGEVHLLDIGLHPSFLKNEEFNTQLITDSLVREIYHHRNPFAHKGNFGHALLISGSYGKIGAAVLAAKACLRTGVGLLSCFLPECGYTIMQTAVPEAMVIVDENEYIITNLPDEIEKYTVIGVGPGIGTADKTQNTFSFILKRYQKPIVADADALNILSIETGWLKYLPANSVLTPHPKEFDRLFGEHSNDFERMNQAVEKAKDLRCVIVLKSHHTFIATPDGRKFFNSTGNAGMAKGGSGDVLTGIITALAAQNYQPWEAAVLGVYLHGLAGDFAATAKSQESMIASDIIDSLSLAFLQLK